MIRSKCALINLPLREGISSRIRRRIRIRIRIRIRRRIRIWNNPLLNAKSCESLLFRDANEFFNSILRAPR
jgi:hypothetical protein